MGNPATLKHAWLGMLGPKNAVKLKAHQSQAVNFGAACPDHFTEVAGGRHKPWSPGGQMNKGAGGEVFRGCPLHARRTGSQVGRGGWAYARSEVAWSPEIPEAGSWVEDG